MHFTMLDFLRKFCALTVKFIFFVPFFFYDVLITVTHLILLLLLFFFCFISLLYQSYRDSSKKKIIWFLLFQILAVNDSIIYYWYYFVLYTRFGFFSKKFSNCQKNFDSFNTFELVRYDLAVNGNYASGQWNYMFYILFWKKFLLLNKKIPQWHILLLWKQKLFKKALGSIRIYTYF